MQETNQLPSRIGRYEVRSMLGSGAMGAVYLAEDPKIKRRVAIKVVRWDALGNGQDHTDCLNRFQREAEVSGLLNHPGIVAIYDLGECELGPFLAMEYVQGKTLESYIKAPSLNVEQKLHILADVAAALDHAHGHNIVHRDIKPANVIVTAEGRAKLTDFGIAKRDDTHLTQVGTFLGTPSYASPEQIIDGRATCRSDIFSFGVMAFELLSGMLPFPGETLNTVLYKVVNEPPLEMRKPLPGLTPEAWQMIFSKALSKDPEERYPTCVAFMMALLEAVRPLDKEVRQALMAILKPAVIKNLEAPVPVVIAKPQKETLYLPPLKTASKPIVKAKPKKRHSVMGCLLGMGGLAALAGAGAWYFLHTQKAKPVTFLVQPEAQVLVEGRELGASGTPLALRKGTTVTLARLGYEPLTYHFDGQERQPHLVLTPRVSEETLKTSPPGATAVMDGAALTGTTPIQVEAWDQSKRHTLVFTHAASGKTLTAHYEEGDAPGERVHELLVQPTRHAKGLGTSGTSQTAQIQAQAPALLKVEGNFPVTVTANGKRLSDTAANKMSLSPGRYQLLLSNSKLFYKEAKTVSLQAGQTLALKLPDTANITVFHPAGDEVIIDGIPAGVESDGTTLIRLVKGRHQVRVQGREAVENIVLKGDQSIRFGLK